MMRSATAFLPDSMITFMNLERSTEPNFGSGRMSRLGTSRRRGIALPLVSVGAGLAVASGGHQDRPLTRRRRDAVTMNRPARCATRKISDDGLQAVSPVNAA